MDHHAILCAPPSGSACRLPAARLSGGRVIALINLKDRVPVLPKLRRKRGVFAFILHERQVTPCNLGRERDGDADREGCIGGEGGSGRGVLWPAIGEGDGKFPH
ncbi:protein of unknown function [Candidatus Methylomirabilis oxygeniifera]|uniref:Uncharacterized protein n=1 Tax=Methylomirabilis oxygeniifera TaxID=671143 RepID=D5MJG0_METO1|nr:protein of unknown function [Candidatus Methylomirabilis oxyfera]